jgi:hypothetical protein
MYCTVGTAAGANAVVANGAAGPATAGAVAATGCAAFTAGELEKYDAASAPPTNAISATAAAPMLGLIANLLGTAARQQPTTVPGEDMEQVPCRCGLKIRTRNILIIKD